MTQRKNITRKKSGAAVASRCKEGDGWGCMSKMMMMMMMMTHERDDDGVRICLGLRCVYNE
eukprot:1151767-Pelagomonas_calceolata.AAC.7